MNKEVRLLFHELAELPLAERDQYFRERQIPADVRAEVESLLRFDDEAGVTLSGVVEAAAEELLRRDGPVRPGARCGPYRLLELLGNGGMGAVYLAERADGEIEHRVAIKFLRASAELPSFRERFLRERQILASLNHPGIARLLDAGHTHEHPYLVMEYVAGTRIDVFAEKLDVRGILMLFLRVADAVAHAHRNLIIHRDLKPSNILINEAGHPKLLDFGIAKILDAPEETRTIERMMTPEYASPEQLRGEARATTTDIYSLGAVLLKVLKAREVPRDLRAILEKAMRPEPDERYPSIEAFAADVRAFLNHRAVTARRGNAWYLTRKFLRRYWIPVAAASLAIAGLAGGLVLAEQQRVVAERRFQQVRQLANKFFELDAEIRTLPGSTKARQRLVSDSLDYLQRLGSEARPGRWMRPRTQDHELALEIGSAYLQVARVQGVPGNASLGDFQAARKSLERGNGFVDPVLADAAFPRRRAALLTSAEIDHDLAILAQSENRLEDAVQAVQRAVARLEELLTAGSPSSQEATAAARLYVNLALACSNMHRMEDAVRYAQRSVELSRGQKDDKQLSRGLSVLANAARFSGDLDGALQAIQEARAIAERQADPDNSQSTLTLCGALWREGLILGELNNINLDRPQEAIPLLERAMDLAEAIARKDAVDYSSRTYVAMTAIELGDIVRAGAPARALAAYEKALERLRETKENRTARRYEIWASIGEAYALRGLNRPGAARQQLDAALALLREVKEYPAAEITLGEAADATLRAVADHQAAMGQVGEAAATYRELLRLIEASKPHPQEDLRHANGLARLYRDLAALERRAGNAAEADRLERLRMEIWRHWERALPGNAFVRRQMAL